MQAAIKAFEKDERVQFVATNDTRMLDPNMIKSESESGSKSVCDKVYQNPLSNEQWSIKQFDIPEILEEIDDSEIKQITVAILDTGVDLQHEDLKDALVKGYNFISNNEDTNDDYGHGTHISGIVGAVNNDKGIVGVASGVKIMPVKILNNQGSGDVMTEIKGIIWAVNNGANMINLSVGGRRYKDGVDAFNPVEYAAIQYAISKGVVVVAATGNYSEAVSYPAAYPDVIAVTSVNQLGDYSIFNNFGEEVSIAAPGEDIYSTMPGNTYEFQNGTSVAAPFVTGLTALILAKNNQLNPYEVKQIIEAGADDKGEPGKDDQYGYGIVNPKSSIGLPLVKVKSSSSNMFYPEKSLQFSLIMEDINQNVQSSVSNDVYQDLYSFEIDFDKSYGNYFYGNYHLEKESVVSIVYGKGEQEVLLKEPGFYETRTCSLNQEYAGNRYKFTLFPEAPKANLKSGYYQLPINLELSTSLDEGTVYYTTDGESPLKDGKLRSEAKCYSEPIRITDDVNINAITILGKFTSSVASYWYRQPILDPLLEIEEENPIIETDNYILKVEELGNCNVYTLELKDYIQLKDTQYFTIDLSQTSVGSSYDKILRSKSILKKFADLKIGVIIKYSDFDLIIPYDQVYKMKSIDINQIQLEIISLIRETAEKQLPLFQDEVKNINLSSNIVKTDLRYFKDGEEFFPEETSDIRLKLTIRLKKEESQDGQWLDLRKMGVFKLVDGISYEYYGGELDISDNCFKIEVKPEKQILFAAENNQSFKDIQNHWAQKYIEVLASRQIIQAFNEGDFFPDETISRAEFVTMLVKALEREEREIRNEYQGYFKDVLEEEWYSTYIEKAKEIGLISGTSEDLFKPEKSLTREEALIILMRIYEMSKKNNYLFFEDWKVVILLNEERVAQSKISVIDINEVSDWAKPEIIKGLDTGIICGYPDGTIRPKNVLTKAEASVLMVKLFEKCSSNR
ncbi:hypothetical protein JCM14036_16920 [Desulfotomaculum defluvii]